MPQTTPPTTAQATTLDLPAFDHTPLTTEPFDHLIVPRFVKPDQIEAVRADFPQIAKGGSYPFNSLSYGPAFAQLLDDLQGQPMRHAFERKFNLDLSNHPTTLTVRGKTREKDGQIHTDSKTKVVTVLIYLNDQWTDEGGRLRLLRSPDDLEDMITEITPEQGTLVAFRCEENAWHGHKPHVGDRMSLQLNWVTDQAAADKTYNRHRLSALTKKLNPFT